MPPILMQPGLTVDTSIAAPPSVTLSIMSTTSVTTQCVIEATALLKRIDRYTEANLMAFLADKYPEIPEERRHSLMIGAFTGAQTAAQLHVLIERAKTARDQRLLSQQHNVKVRRPRQQLRVMCQSEGPILGPASEPCWSAHRL